MFLKLLSLDLRSRIRSPFWQKSIGINIVLILLALYFMLAFLGLGFVLDKLILEFYPAADPLRIFNQFLLYYLIGELVMRFFMQNLPVTAIRSYLLLPVRKQQLAHYLLVKSIPEIFNLLPLLFLIPFFFTTVRPSWGDDAWSWLALGCALILINHFLAIQLKRSFMIKPVPGMLMVLGLVAVAFLDYRGWLPFSNAFGNWVEWTAFNPWSLLLPILLLGGLYFWAYRSFFGSLYLDKLSRSSRQEATDSGSLDWLNRFGKIGRLIQLDLQLIRRNKRPRIMAYMSIFFLLYPLMVLQDGIDDKLGIAVFVSIFTTGLFMINYGQFMLAWESSFFDFLRVRKISIEDYFEGKFYLFGLATMIALILSMAYALIYPILPIFFVAGALFNMGVSSFILMFTATYNVRKIDLSKGAFLNWEGVGASQFLLIIPIMILPMLIYWLFSLWGGIYTGLGAISVLGLAGMMLKDPIIKALARQFERRKYIMTSSFKKD